RLSRLAQRQILANGTKRPTLAQQRQPDRQHALTHPGKLTDQLARRAVVVERGIDHPILAVLESLRPGERIGEQVYFPGQVEPVFHDQAMSVTWGGHKDRV